MIGGIDIAISARNSDSGLVAAVRAILQYWPRAVFENGTTGERYNHLASIPFGRVQEIFVYRDAAIADAWDAEGAIHELYDTMVHLLADDDRITLVVDSTEGPIAELVDAVRSA